MAFTELRLTVFSRSGCYHWFRLKGEAGHFYVFATELVSSAILGYALVILLGWFRSFTLWTLFRIINLEMNHLHESSRYETRIETLGCFPDKASMKPGVN